MKRSVTAQIRRGVAPQFSVPVTAPSDVSPQEPSTQVPPPLQTAPTTNVHYPSFAPQPVTTAAPQSVTLDRVSVEDVDRLWDWVRADAEGTSAFLGATFANSRDLFTYVGKVAEQERSGHAAFYAIREGDGLRGFILLWPIYRETGKNPVATTHIYLEPESRGRLASLLPALMHEADRLAPGVNLCVITQRQEWAAMLKSAGFESQFVLTRPSPVNGAT